MTTWIIGDVHGHARTLDALLTRISVTGDDKYIFLGDYLNKGANSPEVIRIIKSLPHVRYILGNHDLHGLAMHYGHKREGVRCEGFEQINSQADSDSLWEWLSAGELMIVDHQDRWVAAHAGIWHKWTISDIERIIELKSRYSWQDILTDSFVKPVCYDDTEAGLDGLRAAVAVCTTLRFLTDSGRIDWHEFRSPPQPGLIPWFDVPHCHGEYDIYFGHWAMIRGFHKPGFRQLDGGVAYGGKLMAYGLESGTLVEVPVCKEE